MINAGVVVVGKHHTAEVADGASLAVDEQLGPDVMRVSELGTPALALVIKEAVLVLEEPAAVWTLASSAA